VTKQDPIAEAARRRFGYRSLRPGQREAIQSVIDKRDTLAVLATGVGKSAIYELAGPLLRGSTVVVSPLIALQRDQLTALEAAGDMVAIALNSEATAGRRRQLLDEVSRRDRPPDFVFLAPEQLVNTDVIDRLAALRPVLLAVDEAHLVSQWGPDFRPDYLRIAPALDAIGRPVVLALTATAAPAVRDEIVARLRMRQPQVLVHGFGRDNIRLSVHSYFTDERHKLEVVTADVIEAVHTRGRGIVYGATHRAVETLAERLSSRGLRAISYHAGLRDDVRRVAERRFHEGDADVIVATIAFGMGIDKPDTRWVFHVDVPGSPDQYYQEFGRAGRDGEHAEAVLYFRTEDLSLPRRYAAGTGPSPAALNAVMDAVSAEPGAVTMTSVQHRTGLSRRSTEAAAMALADAGGIRVCADGEVVVSGDRTEAVTAASYQVQARRAIERGRVEIMKQYAEHVGCRWNFLLGYFGEQAPTRCGHCDNDERNDANAGEAQGPRPFARGARVRHDVFGEGDVVGYVGSLILIAFDTAGYRRFELNSVIDANVLQGVGPPMAP
jgi:ATP-dependent DNA helicase RecQ